MAAKVEEIMARDPITVETNVPLNAALSLMDEHHIRHLPVVRDGYLVGLLSDRDLVGEMGALVGKEGREPLFGTAATGDLIRKRPVTVVPEDTTARAAELMSSERIGCVPVCRGDALVGLVTETDLLEAFHGSARYGRLSTEEDPRVEEVMSRDLVTVPFEASLRDAQIAMIERDVRHLVVLDGDGLVGVLSDRDLRRCADPRSIELRCAGEVATRDVRVAHAGETLSTAARRMAHDKISALVVQSGGVRPVGILTVTDVLAFAARVQA